MYELPLFPLKTVLFPGMPLNLHIFEPRYKLMIEQCIQNNQPFGVVLIRQGVEAFGPPAEPHLIGCTARITQVERLENEHINIVAMGVERFEIHSIMQDKPYLIGMVETCPVDDDHHSPASTQASAQLRPWVERYLTQLSQFTNDMSFDPQQLPDDPLTLAYLAASLVQIPLDQKQGLLTVNHVTDLLTTIRTIYRHELPLLTAILERELRQDHKQLFSRN